MTLVKSGCFFSSIFLVVAATSFSSQTCISEPPSFALQNPVLDVGRRGLGGQLKPKGVGSLHHFGVWGKGLHRLRGGHPDNELGSELQRNRGDAEGRSGGERETEYESGKEEFMTEADAVRELREAGDDLGEHTENEDVDEDMEETFQVSAVNPPHKKGLLTCTPQELRDIDPTLYTHLANKLGAPSETPGNANDPGRKYALADVLAEVRRHRKDMEGLEAADPNFFQFLKSRDDGQELLDFGVSPDDPAYEVMLKYGHPDVIVRRDGKPLRSVDAVQFFCCFILFSSPHDTLVMLQQDAIQTAGRGQMVFIEEGASCKWEGVTVVTHQDLHIAADPGAEVSGRWALQEGASGSFTTATCTATSQDADHCTLAVQSGPWHFRSCRISIAGGMAVVRCEGGASVTLDGTYMTAADAGCRHALLCSDTSSVALSYCTLSNCGRANEPGSGGIHVSDSATLTATECLIANNTVGLFLAGSANAELDACKIENDAKAALEVSTADSPAGGKSGVGLKLAGCTITGVHWAPGSGRPRRFLQRKNLWVDEEGFVRVR